MPGIEDGFSVCFAVGLFRVAVSCVCFAMSLFRVAVGLAVLP